MAKVTTPLLSFTASGQVAQTLVYFPWKGLDVVRSYVRPANPNTAGQQTQRGYFADAVADWHDIGLDAVDVAAWNRYASSLTLAMSGFNAFVRDHVDIAITGETPNMGFDGSLTDDGDDTFSGSIEEGGSADAADMIWGTSPTALNTTTAGSETANVWAFTPSDTLSGVRVYARFVIKLSGNVIGRTGVFTVDIA
jgi:hypothetical protein